MATTVHFIQKNGTPGRATFPTRTLAESYARMVKAARLEDYTHGDVAQIEIERCPEGTADAQREATRAYYEPGAGAFVPPRITAERSSERRAEAMNEHFGRGREAGQYIGDTFADWDVSEENR